MSVDSDWLVDRRRLKRRLTWWQTIAVIGIVAAIIAAVGRFDRWIARAHVARIDIEGVIVTDADRDQALSDLADDDSARALIVRIDSPGGTVVGGEALYSRLRQIAEKKPIVAVMGEVATSAAYMTAIGSDHIVAHEGTLTGSIGVILQTADVTGLLDKVGIKPEAIKSSPLKAQPNPLEPFTPEAREATRKVVSDIYEMFVSMVQKRRGLSREQVDMVADGSVFTGRQAKAIGLVDILGGEREARAWLSERHGIDQSLPVQDVQPRGTGQELRDMVGGFIGKALFPERLTLDGLVSVWHPSH
jgi:protease IV